MAHSLRAFLLLLAAGLATTPAVPAVDSFAGSEVLSATVDKDKVRYGEISTFDSSDSSTHKVGTVRSTEVYDETEQRKIIKREGIKKGTARYNQLMKEATQAYKSALKQVASDKSLKLIVEEGGISGYDDDGKKGLQFDVTSDVIAALN